MRNGSFGKKYLKTMTYHRLKLKKKNDNTTSETHSYPELQKNNLKNNLIYLFYSITKTQKYVTELVSCYSRNGISHV